MIREETRAFKRARIIETASRLFFELGYEATTVGLLSKELGVTKPFIYSYFDNKQDILEAVYHQSAERILMNVELVESQQGSPDKALAEFIRMFVNENILHQVTAGVFLQEEKHLSPEALKTVQKIERSVNKRLKELIQHGIDQGVFMIEDAGIAALAIIGMVRWVHRWYRRDGRLKPEMVAQQLSELGLNMVRYNGQSDSPAEQDRDRMLAGLNRR
jgi:AcrR family transcriptional regulator